MEECEESERDGGGEEQQEEEECGGDSGCAEMARNAVPATAYQQSNLPHITMFSEAMISTLLTTVFQ